MHRHGTQEPQKTLGLITCEATGQSPGARRASFFLSHEQKVHMSVRVILGREAMLQQMNAQGPCYSSPKENLLHFSISSVGRLDHPQKETFSNSGDRK